MNTSREKYKKPPSTEDVFTDWVDGVPIPRHNVHIISDEDTLTKGQIRDITELQPAESIAPNFEQDDKRIIIDIPTEERRRILETIGQASPEATNAESPESP